MIYNTIDEFIMDAPFYCIPYDFKSLCLHIRYPDLYELSDRYNDKMELLHILQDEQNFKILKNGKIIFYETSIPYGMVRCNNCGNVWDGNAQCDCF